MQSDDPAFFTVGTEVSAKFKGAFCEAKITDVVKSIKCKVLLKEAPFKSITVDHTAIKGNILKVNQIVDVQQNTTTVKAMIKNVKDCSKYHVVFNDGEEKVVRRTQLRLKGARHFNLTQNLDMYPLSNPELFTMNGKAFGKNKKQNKRSLDDDSTQKRKKTKNG